MSRRFPKILSLRDKEGRKTPIGAKDTVCTPFVP